MVAWFVLRWRCCLVRMRLDALVEYVDGRSHPFDSWASEEFLVRNVRHIVRSDPDEVIRERDKMCHMLMEMKKVFAIEESELHAKMHPSLAGVFRGKSLCVLCELLKRCGHGDTMLVEDLSNGFALVGDLGCSGVLVPCLRSAAITVEELVSAAKAAGQSQEARIALWKATIKEVEQGVLAGPFTSDEVTGLLGCDNWLSSVRFPVPQKDKMRPVDDFSRSLVNASVTTREKIRPDGVDAIAGSIVALHRAAKFGAVGSVQPSSERQKGRQKLGLLWSVYFHDYGQVELQQSHSAELTSETLMKATRWQPADRKQAMAPCFDAQ
eukprot:635011-Amphidinium_carterae.1